MRPQLSPASLLTRFNSASLHSISQILFNNIPPLLLSLQSGLFYSEFLTKIVFALLAHECNMARTAYQHGLGHHNIWREIQKMDLQLYIFIDHFLSLLSIHSTVQLSLTSRPFIFLCIGDTLSFTPI